MLAICDGEVGDQDQNSQENQGQTESDQHDRGWVLVWSMVKLSKDSFGNPYGLQKTDNVCKHQKLIRPPGPRAKHQSLRVKNWCWPIMPPMIQLGWAPPHSTVFQALWFCLMPWHDCHVWTTQYGIEWRNGARNRSLCGLAAKASLALPVPCR